MAHADTEGYNAETDPEALCGQQSCTEHFKCSRSSKRSILGHPHDTQWL